MSHRRRDENDDDLEPEEEHEEERCSDGDGGGRKRQRSEFINNDEDDDGDDDDFNGGSRSCHRRPGSQFFDLEAAVVSDDEEDEEEGEDDFIVDDGADLPEEDGRRMSRRPLLPREDDQEDFEALERSIQARYARSSHMEYDEDTTYVEQQALFPSVRDPKLWMVRCAMGREREAAICLMQKYIDKGSEIQIRSAIVLDHLKNFIYIEADKEAHVKEACMGMRNMFANKLTLVPIIEMTDVLSVESKAVNLSRDTWVRMKIGIYKGDLAKVVDVDNVRQRVTVKLIPRIDLQAIAKKLEGREVPKKAFIPPPRFMNVDEAREMHIRVERRRDPMTGDYFENVGGMMFKDGLLYKSVSMKSIGAQNIRPTVAELEKFWPPVKSGYRGGDGDMVSLSTLFADRTKGHFVKGDQVVIVKGDLIGIMGWVEKVEESTVYIRHSAKDLPNPLAVNDKQLCKYFEPGNHVKVVSGASEGVTGTVIAVKEHKVTILSDTIKDQVSVFSDNLVKSSEVTSGVTRIGDYELHDLVQLDNLSFGIIIRVESEALRVLKGVPERPDVVLVRLRDIKRKLDNKTCAQDRWKNTISVKDVVRILEGPCKGKQGPVQHIFKGTLFVYDRHHLQHAGFICAKAKSCIVVGGFRTNSARNSDLGSPSRVAHLRTPPRVSQSPMRLPRGGRTMDYGGNGRHGGGRGCDSMVGTTIKVRQGIFKGYRGRVIDVKGPFVRVELESLMKVVTVDRDHISDNMIVSTSFCDTPRCGSTSETPMHPSRTPLHPYMTSLRDSGTTPIHDGMRTPMHNRAWNPYTPMSPPRDNWEDGNPASWGTSPQYRPRSPPSRTYEALTPGSGWANTPSGNYSETGTPRDSRLAYDAPSPYLPSTPGGHPATPSSAYLPATPSGQPMTPGSGVLDIMSPVVGVDNEGPWFSPDILVNVRRFTEDTGVGVNREVLPDGLCRIALGSSGNGETITALPNEIDTVIPRKSEKVKIMGGAHRGATGKLIGIDGTDGIVKVDDNYEIKILDISILAKLAQV